MKRCPVCGSRKWHGYRGRWKCGRCGKIWEERTAIQEANNDMTIDSIAIQEAKCDGGITNEGIQSHIITNSSLFQEIYDLHNKAYKFKITRDNSTLNLPRIEGFDGKIFIINHNGFKVRKTSNWLIIYKNGRDFVPLKDLDKTSATIIEGMRNLAIEISHKYEFEIDSTPLPFSKNRPEVKTPFLSSNNFYEDEAKAVYPVPSPIELHGGNSVNNALNLSSVLVQLNQNILLEIQNKQLHQKVLEHMDETLGKIEDKFSVPTPKGVSDKNILLGLLSSKLDRTKQLLFNISEAFK